MIMAEEEIMAEEAGITKIMTNKLQQTIKEELAKLPKENQEAINAVDWVLVSSDIGKRNRLNEDEINNLQVEILLELIGMEDPEVFAGNIEDEVGTSKEEAKKISKEVFEKIFDPINEKLLENIKKSEKIRNTAPEQTIDFILSGGDYSTLVGNHKEEVPDYSPNRPTTIPVKPVKIEDIKSKLNI
jgi:hypothetical protein